jgi:hypothetical protein
VLEPSLKAWKEYKRLATYLRDAEVRIEVSIGVAPSIHLAKTRTEWKRNIPPIIVSEFICQKRFRAYRAWATIVFLFESWEIEVLNPLITYGEARTL